MSEEIKISLTASLIGLVAPFIGRGDIRYYLDGINIRPAEGGGAIIAATNGHAMGYVLDRDAVCEKEVTLRITPAIIRECAIKPIAAGRRRLAIFNGRLTVLVGETGDVCIQAGDPVIQGNYPNIWNVVPEPETLVLGMIGGYSQAVLDKVNQAARAWIKSKGRHMYSPVEFYTEDGNRDSKCVVRIHECPNFFAVLMPARCDGFKESLPDFIRDGLKLKVKK